MESVNLVKGKRVHGVIHNYSLPQALHELFVLQKVICNLDQTL
jgi:hypothetical protein